MPLPREGSASRWPPGCARRALAAVLLYRLVSFWLVALAGWLILVWLRHPWRHAGAGEQNTATTANTEAAQAIDPPGP